MSTSWRLITSELHCPEDIAPRIANENRRVSDNKRKLGGTFGFACRRFFETFWICQSASQKTGFISIGHGRKTVELRRFGRVEAFFLRHGDGAEVFDSPCDLIQAWRRDGHFPGPGWPVEPNGDCGDCGWSPAPGECLVIAHLPEFWVRSQQGKLPCP